MHLSIVTGTYNRLPLLQRFIYSVRDQLPPGILYEFVICGVEGDTDTLDYLRAQTDVHLIVHPGLLGAVRAFTDACNAAVGNYVLIANDDVEIVSGSILTALVHLEETPRAGAVAFRDNRLNRDVFKAAYVPIQLPNGQMSSAPYVQIGIVRNWLGSHVGWWDLHGTFPARTYGADNAMSAAIIECGYTIDDIDGCKAIDYMHDDELRAINTANPGGGEHPDSLAYYERWPHGAKVPHEPTITAPKPNGREIGLRVLYLPIYEAGNNIPQQKQRAQKHGLRDALCKLGMVYELDYLKYQHRTGEFAQEMTRILNSFQPDMLLMQVHATDVLTLEMLRNIRAMCPYMVIVNWNGDYWPEGQLSEKMMHWLRFVDLALVVNADMLAPYEDVGIPAAYWQIGFETPAGDLPEVKAHDVVFLGQNYNNHRRKFGDALLELTDEGIDIGIYGNYWVNADSPSEITAKAQYIYPDCTYDFLQGRALYQNAKITVANNPFPDSLGFVSNRIFEALSAGGALMLHQYVKGLEDLTGLKAGVHYIEWKTYDELKQWIRYFLDPAHEADRKRIADAAYRYVQHYHSFDERVRQLFLEFLPMAKTKLRRTVNVLYRGRRNTPFGLKGARTQQQYQCVPGVPLAIDTLDLEGLLRSEPDLWQEIGTPQGDRVGDLVHGR